MLAVTYSSEAKPSGSNTQFLNLPDVNVIKGIRILKIILLHPVFPLLSFTAENLANGTRSHWAGGGYI
jgi:hypothetical protein